MLMVVPLHVLNVDPIPNPAYVVTAMPLKQHYLLMRMLEINITTYQPSNRIIKYITLAMGSIIKCNADNAYASNNAGVINVMIAPSVTDSKPGMGYVPMHQ